MSRNKRERTSRKRKSSRESEDNQGQRPEGQRPDGQRPQAAEAVDLRSERPVRRLAGQVRIHAQGLINRCATLETWSHPKGDGPANPLVAQAHETLCHVVEGFPKFFATMTALDDLGFSPPRKSYTAGTVEGDRVTVLESCRARYDDLMDPDSMIDMLVERVYPGKGGGFVVSSKTGERLKVAKCHVVKLS